MLALSAVCAGTGRSKEPLLKRPYFLPSGRRAVSWRKKESTLFIAFPIYLDGDCSWRSLLDVRGGRACARVPWCGLFWTGFQSRTPWGLDALNDCAMRCFGVLYVIRRIVRWSAFSVMWLAWNVIRKRCEKRALKSPASAPTIAGGNPLNYPDLLRRYLRAMFLVPKRGF